MFSCVSTANASGKGPPAKATTLEISAEAVRAEATQGLGLGMSTTHQLKSASIKMLGFNKYTHKTLNPVVMFAGVNARVA